jgi:PAS domain S-box-containing protein
MQDKPEEVSIVNLSNIELSDVIDAPALQEMMDDYFALTGIGVGIVDLNGNVLVGTGWQDICVKFHRAQPESCQFCHESDFSLSSGVTPGTFKAYRCKNNMWDIASPIMLGDIHIGNIFLGQFLYDDEIPDYELFRAQAKLFGYDEAEYIAALDKVPRWSRDTVNTAMSYYSKLAQMISKASYNYYIARIQSEAERKLTEEALLSRLQVQNEELRAAEEELRSQNNELQSTEEMLRVQINEYETGQKLLKGSEESLSRQNRLFSSLLQILPIGIFMVEAPSGKPLVANESACNLLGRGILPDASKDNLSNVYRAFKTGTADPYPIEEMPVILGMSGVTSHIDDMEVERPDGTKTLLEIFGSPVVDDKGNIWASLVSFIDITERTKAEEALKESESRWKFALEGAGDGVWDWNIQSGEAFYSPRYKEMLGYSEDDIGNTSDEWVKRIHPDDIAGVRTTLKPYLEGKAGTATVEFRMLCKDGGWKPLLGRGMVVGCDREGKPLRMIGTNTDLTERIAAEQERRSIELQMQHAQKLESLGVLAGGIAHDFNNILMAIMGNADLALMRINKESPAVENLHRIEQAAARAADLAKQMLAYSGKGKFVVENIDLNILLEEMLHMLEVSISKKAVLRLNLYTPLPTVEADATQMRQIIMNLVINASEAIGDKSGIIAITTGCMDCDRNYLKGIWLDENISEGLYVYLEIADTGCGMDKETITKLFDPFFTTKFAGRGLGMAAVLGIVRGHKGAIKVYSEPKRGTTFKILLPASNRPAEIFNGASHHDDWKGEGTVLLVDDEETVRGIGAEMLRELGFSVITADDGREGVEAFRNNPDISFVILDLTMPHMDGEQCFRELKQLNPNVKVIMSSGYNEQEVTQKFVGKGLAGFIQKPYKMSVLEEAIRKMLN